MSGHRRISTDLFLEERKRARAAGHETTPIEALLELDLDQHRGTWPASGPPVKTYARLWGWTPGRARRLILRWKAHQNDLYNGKTADPLRTPSVPPAYPDPDPQNETVSDTYGEPANSPRTLDVPQPEPLAYPILEPEPEPEPNTYPPAASGERLKSKRRKPARPCPERLEPEERDRVLAWLAEPKNRSLDRDELNFAWSRFRAWAHSDDHRRRDWARAFENALAEGWPLRGYGSDPRRSSEEARGDRTKNAARAAVALVRADRLRLVGGGIG